MLSERVVTRELADKVGRGKQHHDATADGNNSTQGDRRHAVTKTFVVVTRTALVVAIVLAGMTAVFSYLAAVSAQGPKCAGRAWVESYGVGIDDFWVPAVWSALIVVVVGFAASGRSTAMRNVLREYDLPVFEFASMQITLGEFVIYSTLLVALAMIGFVTGFSIMRYNAIVSYCLVAIALN
jgi:hypothetical protein